MALPRFGILFCSDGSQRKERHRSRTAKIRGRHRSVHAPVGGGLPDGQTALFDMGVDAEADAKDGYVPKAIFQIELATGKMTRVTPKGIEADHPS